MKSTRKRIAAVGGGIIVGVLAIGAYQYATFDREAAMARMLVPAVSPDRPDGSPFTAEHHADLARLHEIGRKSRWDQTDAGWVRDIVSPAWPDVPLDFDDMVQMEQLDLLTTAVAILNDRRQEQLNIPASVIGEYRSAIVAMLKHPQPYMRRKGAAAAGNGRWLDDHQIGPMVAALAERDPDDQVRRTAGIKLGQAAGVESPADYCPTCPGKVTP